MTEEQLLEQLAAIDAPSDPDDGDIDVPEPEDLELDPAPAPGAEGDDRKAGGAIA